MTPDAVRSPIELLSLFADIGDFDLGTASRVELLVKLGEKIQERTGVATVMFAVTDDPLNDDPKNPTTDVTVVKLPGREVRIARKSESWWATRLREPATGRTFRERTTFSTIDADLGELIAPIRFTDTFFGVVRLTGPRDQFADIELWATGLFAITQTLSAQRLVAKRAERQEFYRALVGVASHDPNETSSIICDLWHKMSRADWTWLWLFNEYNKRFELAAFSEKAPPKNFEPNLASASAYAVDSGNVVMARGDFSSWYREFRGKGYRLAYASLVNTEYGCQSFVCVPLDFPQATAGPRTPTELRVTGAVCLHYKDPNATPQQLKDSLQLIGRQCAQSIANAFSEEQRRVLVRLAEMAQKHLTRVSRRPAQVRKEYLAELIELIGKELRFQTISLFYRRPFDELIECVASTGIADADEKRIPDNRLYEITYRKNQGSTGTCFAKGMPYVVNKLESDPGHPPSSFDIDPASGRPLRGAVFYPIKQPVQPGQVPTVIGIIRCGGHRVPADRRHDAAVGRIGIHPVQVQTLELISQQVGPMLQIFENNIRREQTISVVKHDLFSPLNMMRDTSERIADDLAAGKMPREYDIKNLGVSHIIASNLVAQLDAEPGEQGDYDPRPTRLVGDILARVVNMLQQYAWSYREMEIHYDAEAIIQVIPILKIDRILVERAIHNILVNAVKYGTPRTKIRIEARASRGGFLLDISNDGIGVEEKDAKYIGQLHFRAETAKSVAQGIGLGMFIARRAMERHGGSLFIHSAKNPTTFSLFFPKTLTS